MLELADAWTWDFWFADDGDRFHLFALKAPRELGDPALRHHNASLAHAVSDDLTHWSLLPDALVPGTQPAFDDRAIWTGSVVRGDTGRWRMFYTGISHSQLARIQTIGYATSEDLVAWQRPEQPWVLEADPRWYETLGEDSSWPEQAWRDPGWCVTTTGSGTCTSLPALDTVAAAVWSGMPRQLISTGGRCNRR